MKNILARSRVSGRETLRRYIWLTAKIMINSKAHLVVNVMRLSWLGSVVRSKGDWNSAKRGRVRSLSAVKNAAIVSAKSSGTLMMPKKSRMGFMRGYRNPKLI